MSHIRGNLLQVLDVFTHLIFFLQKFMICMHHSDNKSKAFSFVLVSHLTIFHARNCISQNLIFPTHLSFFFNKNQTLSVGCDAHYVKLGRCEDRKEKLTFTDEDALLFKCSN